MLRTFRADLHIHSCLSPCGDEAMRPQAIVHQALAMGLDMIAICDHNSAENVDRFCERWIGKGPHSTTGYGNHLEGRNSPPCPFR